MVVIFLATLPSDTKWEWDGDCSHKSDHTILGQTTASSSQKWPPTST